MSTHDEEQLADLVSRLLERIAAGEKLELEPTCFENPQFETELRELWGTMMVAELAGTESRNTFSDNEPMALAEMAGPSMEFPFPLDNYVLEAEIGRGGMGIVYRARRVADGDTVAIKMMLKGEFASQSDLQRFETEARTASTFDHPNIVSIYEIGQHQGRPFLCMRYVFGQSLAQVLADGPLTNEHAARLLLEVCRGIEHAHAKGVLHRDLKPSNILIDIDGKPVVCDFGLAKQESASMSLTKSGSVIGTPSYMAPEQAAGGARGRVTAASDVYSLGAILYHMLTGRPPFLASTPVDTVLMVLEQDPISPRVLNRNVNRKLEMITMRCLQKPQDLRYASASQLAADLEAYLNHQRIMAADGRFSFVISSLFRETHHAPILENWGLLWIWHSLVVLFASVSTNVMYWAGVSTRLYYELMWIIGLGAWVVVFWLLRRQVGPVTAVERQIAHIWGAAMVGVMLLFPFEGFLKLPLLSLAPVLSVVAGMVFVIKAGILSGTFYIQGLALLATAVAMALIPEYAMVMFGIVCAGCFFFPGLKYYRQRSTHQKKSLLQFNDSI